MSTVIEPTQAEVSWLRCQLDKGMFSDEVAVTYPPKGPWQKSVFEPLSWGQPWDSGLGRHLLHGRLAFVDRKRHLRIGLVVCCVLLDFGIPVRSIIW